MARSFLALPVVCLLGFAAAAVLLPPLARAETTLERVKARGHLVCGIAGSSPGFAEADADGRWRGFDVDYCRAVAAAVFGDAGKVRYRVVGPQEGLSALSAREVDVLSRAVGWSAWLETGLGLRFVGVNFFDGQGLMVHRELGITNVLELSGTKICVGALPDVETHVVDYFTSRDMPVEIISFAREEDAVAGYLEHRCDVYTADVSRMSSERSKFAVPGDHLIVADDVTKEPLGPVVRKGDEQWFDISRWTLCVLIAAEEVGLTSANVQQLARSGTAAIRLLLGSEGELGPDIGLDKAWAFNIINQVGNYAEIFDRNLGLSGGLGLDRGRNNLWNRGGLLYAPNIF